MSLLSPSMDGLPVHVVVNILSRLAVKTIIQCKCVCNKWLKIVSSSYFADLHLSRSPSGLMIYHNSQEEMTGNHKPGILKWVEAKDELNHHNLHHDPVMSLDLNLAHIFQDSLILPVGSVNGLICLWQFGHRRDNTYICNPIIREYMTLPRQQYYREGHAIIVYCFGVDLLTDRYKVIRIFQGDIPPDSTSTSRPSLLEAEVYTLGTCRWRSLGHVPYWLRGFYGPFFNGHAHWIVADQDYPENICVFDFAKETFELFPSPPFEAIEESRISFPSLGVLKGCLCQCDTYDFEFTIQVMKEYGIKKSWQKEVVIKESISPYVDLLMSETVHLIESLKDGTILMVYYEDKLLAYCPRKKTIVDTKILDCYINGLAYRPSFRKLQNFQYERVNVF